MSNARDCCDSDAGSHPGAFYSTSQNACGSWDRNCDGTVSRRYPSTATGFCGPGGGSGTLCLCSDGTCSGWASSVPACGATGSYVTGCSGSGFDCAESIATRQQSCR